MRVTRKLKVSFDGRSCHRAEKKSERYSNYGTDMLHRKPQHSIVCHRVRDIEGERWRKKHHGLIMAAIAACGAEEKPPQRLATERS